MGNVEAEGLEAGCRRLVTAANLIDGKESPFGLFGSQFPADFQDCAGTPLPDRPGQERRPVGFGEGTALIPGPQFFQNGPGRSVDYMESATIDVQKQAEVFKVEPVDIPLPVNILEI
jgi:hypothetical protein